MNEEIKRMDPGTHSDLFKNNGVSVEFVCSISSLLYLSRDGKAQGGELPDLPEQTDQSVGILDLEPAIHMVQVHYTVTGLETMQTERGLRKTECKLFLVCLVN